MAKTGKTPLLNSFPNDNLREGRQDQLSNGIIYETLKFLLDQFDAEADTKFEFNDILGIRSSDIFLWNGLRIRLIGSEKVESEVEETDFLEEIKELSLESLVAFVPFSFDDHNSSLAMLFSNTITFFPADIAALAETKCLLSDLIDYKLFRGLYLERNPMETMFDISLFSNKFSDSEIGTKLFKTIQEVLTARNISINDWVDHPLCDRIYSGIERDEMQIMIGPSASGKSTLAFQVGWRDKISGRKVKYINISQISVASNLTFSSLLPELQGRYASLLIIDDTQANPGLSIYLCKLINLCLKASYEIQTRYLFLTWPNFAVELLTELPNGKAIHIRAEQIKNSILNRFAPHLSYPIANDIFLTFGPDLFLLRACLRYMSEYNKVPSISDLAEQFWNVWMEQGLSEIENDVKRVLIITSSLGRFDLPISSYLIIENGKTNQMIVDKLVSMQILRPVVGLLVLGHRSFSTLIGDWLSSQGVWEEIEKMDGPKSISEMLHCYLRSLSPSKAIDTLRLLHNQSGFKGNIKLSHRTGTLIQIWQAFDSVLERIIYQQSQDPTWSRIPSSAMFAVEALCSIGEIEESKRSIEFLRSIFSFNSENELNIDIDSLPTIDDFEEIGRRMKEEDEKLNNSQKSQIQKMEPVDLKQMHKNWLLGVFLSAEAAYDRSSIYINKLIKYALSIAQPSGGYYPERVPWVTARILLGLAAAGVTSAYDPVVRKAVDWLLKDNSRGGALNNGIWRSGTGSWNSELEVTSMCTIALIRCGIDPDDSRLNAAKGLILASRNNWTNPACILDGALAAEAYLLTGGAWDDIVDEVQYLSHWTKAEAFWRSALKSSSETFTQSCRVAQIASSLVDIAWTAIKSDLPSLVNAFTVPKSFQSNIEKLEQIEVLGNLPPTSSPSISGQQGAIQRLLEMQVVNLSSLSVIGNYRRFNEKIRNRLKDWVHRILEPLTTSSLAHENFLIWASPGSGKTFFVQEIARSQADKIKYCELNLARMNKEDINAKMKEIASEVQPIICLLDEIDARSDETWPYEDIFARLDLNLDPSKRIVFILIGSSRNGIEGLASFVSTRSKGKDLLDRIPIDHRFIIPPLEEFDRMMLILGQLNDAATVRGSKIVEVEKLCLYYILNNEQLRSPRQLGDIARSAVQRLPAGETRFRYIDLFHKNDNSSHRIWIENQHVAEILSEVFITLVL